MMLKAILFDLGGTLLHYHDPESTDNARPFRRVTLAGFDDLLDALEVTGTALPPRAEMHARCLSGRPRRAARRQRRGADARGTRRGRRDA